MTFEVGDLIKHSGGGLEYTVLDVAEDGMTIRVSPRGPYSNMWINRDTWHLWTIIAGQPHAPRPRKTYRNLDL